MRLKTILSFIFVFCFYQGYAQNWLWAKQNGGLNGDKADRGLICIDKDGNTYHAGTFASSPAIFQNISLSPNGNYDFYIAKYDPSGYEVWVRSFGGNNTASMQQEAIRSLVYCKSTNSILISGYFYDQVIFGQDTLKGYPSGGFVAMLDTSGSFQWSKPRDNLGVTSDELGNIYAQLYITDNQIIDTFHLTSGIWLAKFNSAMELQHVKKIFSVKTVGPQTYSYEGILIKFIAKGGKIYAVGTGETQTFFLDNIQMNLDFTTRQYLLACFDTTCSAQWAKAFAGKTGNVVADIVLDENKNIYACGPFNDTAIFSADTLYTNPIAKGDFFVGKYDSSGNYLWAHQGHSSYEYSMLTSLAIDNQNGIYATGYFQDTVIFGIDTLVSAGQQDMFITRYSPSGSVMGIMQVSNTGGSAIICDTLGNITVTGTLLNTANYGNISLTSRGQSDIFIAKTDALNEIQTLDRIISNQLLIYANPAIGSCNVSIPEEFLHENRLTLSIFDNTGRLIQQKTLNMNEGKIRINLDDEAKGIYNITLGNGKKFYSGKVIFQ